MTRGSLANEPRIICKSFASHSRIIRESFMLLLRVKRGSSASASHRVPIRPCAPFLPFPTCSTAAKERKRMSVIRVLLCKGENKRRGGRGAQGDVRKRGGKWRCAVRRRCELTFSRPARASPSQTVPSAACCAPSVCAQGGARKKTKCWRRGVRTRSGKKGRASPLLAPPPPYHAFSPPGPAAVRTIVCTGTSATACAGSNSNPGGRTKGCQVHKKIPSRHAVRCPCATFYLSGAGGDPNRAHGGDSVRSSWRGVRK